MHRALLICLSCLLAAPATAQNRDIDRTLLDALKRNPEFMRQIPEGHVIRSFERTGGISTGQIIWGPNPNEIDITPVAVGNTENVNCFSNRTQEFSGGIDTGYIETSSFSTTVGSSLGQTLSIEAGWPGVGTVGASFTAQITTETGRSKDTTRSVVFPHNYVAVVDPLHYSTAQLQVFEQKIEGQPFEVDIRITGNAIITHAPDPQWLPQARAGRAARVIAGTEKDPRGNSRPLAICRAEHNDAMHPGKIVAGNCNFGYNGTERRASRYEILSMPKGTFRWMDKRDFEDEYPDSDVANLESNAVVAGKEERVDRYDGQLVVCRAKYKGAWHPGKVVINDCMFGYGGKEIEKGRYQVLVQKEIDVTTDTILLSDFLPADLLNFRHKGEFEGTHSSDSKIVLSDQRPVTAEMCPTLRASADEAALNKATTLPREVIVSRTPARDTEAGTLRTLAQDDLGLGQGGDTDVQTTGSPALIEGTLLASASLNDGANPIDWALRVLTPSRPFMRGSDVLVVQKALTDAGWPVLQDGVYGGYTTRAVRLFQRAHGLPPDGIVGPATERALGL